MAESIADLWFCNRRASQERGALAARTDQRKDAHAVTFYVEDGEPWGTSVDG